VYCRVLLSGALTEHFKYSLTIPKERQQGALAIAAAAAAGVEEV
jgi:hypothetical protein